jgi:hypothetical protein
MDLNLYLLVSEPDPRQARVVSPGDLSRLPLPILTYGDRLTLSIYLVTSAGAYHADSTDSSLARTLTLGIRGQSAVAQTSTFVAITNGYRCTLDLTSTALALVLLAARTGQLTLVHKTTGLGPAATTRCSLDCTILGDVATYGDGSSLSTPGYYTAAQVDALLAAVMGTPVAITALTGGGAAALDGIAVAGTLAPGAYRLVYLTSGDLLLYRLFDSTAAESEPWIIAPDDGAAYRWELVSAMSRSGQPLIWNSTQGAFHLLYAAGTAGNETLVLGPALTLGI